MKKTAIQSFEGFTPEAKKFFYNLRNNNNKEWFEKNRHIYEKEIKEPSRQLVEEMAIHFAQLGLPYIADPKRSLFRINRDIRFSPNKEPYKTNMGAFFPFGLSNISHKSVGSPGLYFHFDHSDTFIACGIHQPEPITLKAIRVRIADEWTMLEKILKSRKFKSEFPDAWEGEPLKSMPKGFPKDHPAGKWLRLKEFTYWSPISFKDAYSPGLIELLCIKAVAAADLHNFILEAIEG
jgi:uncharacterized protein (TIGR02453 family)